MLIRKILTGLLLSTLIASCNEDSKSKPSGPVLIDTVGRFEHSNLAGNLMATAIKTESDVDIAFYPSAFLNPDAYAVVDKELSADLIRDKILPLYATSTAKDQFQVGTMRGSEIREFVLNRTTENYRLDLHTAGLE
ncbi:MAG: hypothetical protein EOP04_24670, partial [Proteobacteria bacterium]